MQVKDAPVRPEFRRWREKVAEFEIEHYRGERSNVVVLVEPPKNGMRRCWIGSTKCSAQDTYSKQKGYTIALGRAMAAVVKGWPEEFEVGGSLKGKELWLTVKEILKSERETCEALDKARLLREKLTQRGWKDEKVNDRVAQALRNLSETMDHGTAERTR